MGFNFHWIHCIVFNPLSSHNSVMSQIYNYITLYKKKSNFVNFYDYAPSINITKIELTSTPRDYTELLRIVSCTFYT